jgi:carboxyl-terminal processing protease
MEARPSGWLSHANWAPSPPTRLVRTMSKLARHLLLFSASLPLGLIGYRALSAPVPDEVAGGDARTFGPSDLSLRSAGASHDLVALDLLRRDLYLVDLKYVDKGRVVPEDMFKAALDTVERSFNEVMFVREPQGTRLTISVGTHTVVQVIEPIRTTDDLFARLQPVAVVLDRYLDPSVSRADVEYAFVNGALSSLDPHTIHLPPEAAKEMEVDNQGEFGGLGIEITTKDGRLKVKSALEGTPAARVGLLAEDLIVRIEDESTLNMDLTEAVSKLRGQVGTPVNIMVMREGYTEPRLFTIIRDVIAINEVKGQLLPGDIGYVKIEAFNAKVSDTLDTLLDGFRASAKSKEIKGLVLDMRGNPGGFLNQAVAVSDKFLRDGVIVSTVEGGGEARSEQRATSRGTEPDYPIVVLIDGSSASASEIVAGALRNQDRALVIGERSFGKGSVQHLMQHPSDNSRLKLTVAKYLTPGDQSIQSVGIPPDILLQPSIVEPPKVGPAASPDSTLPMVMLYWREWMERESDLDHNLGQTAADARPATFAVRYLRDPVPPDATTKRDPASDWEVQFARRVLLATKGSRTADLVAGASSVVTAASEEEARRLVAAFNVVGLDWSPGNNAEHLDLAVALDLGADGVVIAGVAEEVSLVVTNNGKEPVYQLSATSRSENPWFDRGEFYFGKLEPGETRRFPRRVVLADGYGAEAVPVDITFRDPGHNELATAQAIVRTERGDLPRFTYRVDVKDDGSGTSKGDGDGIPEVGELIDLVVSVKNTGLGASHEGYVRLKNRAGKALDLRNGGFELGNLVTEAGVPCNPDYKGCGYLLAAGATAVGRLNFEVRGTPSEPEGWGLELRVGDNRGYDYESVQRGGFYDFYELREEFSMKVGQAYIGAERIPPTIDLTRGLPDDATLPGVTISGAVSDDRGIADVIIFHNKDKVFYRGGETDTRSIPFSVDASLTAGENHFYVLARDHQGLTSSHAVGTWFTAPTVGASLPSGTGPG